MWIHHKSKTLSSADKLLLAELCSATRGVWRGHQSITGDRARSESPGQRDGARKPLSSCFGCSSLSAAFVPGQRRVEMPVSTASLLSPGSSIRQVRSSAEFQAERGSTSLLVRGRALLTVPSMFPLTLRTLRMIRPLTFVCYFDLKPKPRVGCLTSHRFYSCVCY